MDLTNGWTGQSACALQAAFRLSNEGFAARLGIATRTVAAWHQKPDLRQQPEMQQLLDTALERAPDTVKERFARLTGHSTTDSSQGGVPQPEQEERAGQRRTPVSPKALERLNSDPNIAAALEWVDQHAGWEPGVARQKTAERLSTVDVQALRDRGVRRGRVDQLSIARALGEYYSGSREGFGRYTARFVEIEAVTSVLTCPEWLDIACPLVASRDRLAVTQADTDAGTVLDEEAAGLAIQRLAETLALGIRLVDLPLYQLLDVDVRDGKITGELGISRFVNYVLTMDLLEGELVDALSQSKPARSGVLPLRDRHLPDVDAVLAFSERMCAGGPLALTAIARPEDPFRGEADYVLLIQERSGHVVNASRRLAVIPKGFHQPMTDIRADAQVGASLRRELEEELFGRDEVDGTVSDQRKADPMHPSRLSEPMRFLLGKPDRLRMECTALGVNLVSGNFEFAGLIVIEDEEFWARYGGDVEANWESLNLRRYSTLDSDLLSELVQDRAWSNEGLYALLQGLRRLREIGEDRVALPEIEWEMQ